MKRLTSNLTNMVLSLTIVALFAAGALGAVYTITKEPIAATKAQKQLQAKADVLSVKDGVTFADAQKAGDLLIYNAYVGDSLVGAAVETLDRNGFNGLIRLMVGFDTEGVITGYTVLEQGETPGLGANMVSWFKTDKNRQSVVGLNPAQSQLTVSKDGGDVDAITAATITSRAFLRAVSEAYRAYMSVNQPSVAVDVASGATAVKADSLAVAAEKVAAEKVAEEKVAEEKVAAEKVEPVNEEKNNE